jgi:HK97 family phage major capsid protein
MSSDIKRMPRRATNLTASFVGEASIASQSNETFDQINLVAKKSMVLTKFSSELSEDAVINFADDLAGEMAYAQAKLEDNCAFIGDSTSTYGGITGLATAVGSAGVSTATSTAFTAITLAQIKQHSLSCHNTQTTQTQRSSATRQFGTLCSCVSLMCQAETMRSTC